jgi:predicted YcjX-like family ATPase
MTEHAIARAKFTGATVDVVALAAVRATHEAMVARGRDKLPAITGTPLAGERLGPQQFDGEAEIASFPGDLPDDPAALFENFTGLTKASETDYRFLRFRPPRTEPGKSGAPTLPHIRLDRALQFLLGDRLA